MTSADRDHPRRENGVLFHPVELDLLCAFADVQPPFPLDVPPTGLSDTERLTAFSGAAQQLAERGLADESGPLAEAEEFVYLLRSCTGVVDLVLAREEITLGAVVLVHRDEALLITQDARDPDGVARVHACTVDSAIDVLGSLLPRAELPVTAPFSLPRRTLERGFDALAEAGANGRPHPAQVEEVLAAQGIDERVLRRMVNHLQPVLGSGQAGAAVRDDSEDQWRRTGDELRWLDTERGRFRLADDGDGAWISVNPLGHDEIRAALRGLATLARR